MEQTDYMKKIEEYGGDILVSEGMLSEKQFVQHGTTTTYDHSVAVTEMCLRLAKKFHSKADERTLIRGALLHDYFLYDWHKPHGHLHAFRHPKRALENAARDFELSPVERNMILSHMFPLGRFPRYRESVLLCIADKICSLRETFRRKKPTPPAQTENSEK